MRRQSRQRARPAPRLLVGSRQRRQQPLEIHQVRVNPIRPTQHPNLVRPHLHRHTRIRRHRVKALPDNPIVMRRQPSIRPPRLRLPRQPPRRPPRQPPINQPFRNRPPRHRRTTNRRHRRHPKPKHNTPHRHTGNSSEKAGLRHGSPHHLRQAGRSVRGEPVWSPRKTVSNHTPSSPPAHGEPPQRPGHHPLLGERQSLSRARRGIRASLGRNR